MAGRRKGAGVVRSASSLVVVQFVEELPSMRGVHAQQLHQDIADRFAVVRGASLHFAPQVGVDASQGIGAHRPSIVPAHRASRCERLPMLPTLSRCA